MPPTLTVCPSPPPPSSSSPPHALAPSASTSAARSAITLLDIRASLPRGCRLVPERPQPEVVLDALPDPRKTARLEDQEQHDRHAEDQLLDRRHVGLQEREAVEVARQILDPGRHGDHE